VFLNSDGNLFCAGPTDIDQVGRPPRRRNYPLPNTFENVCPLAFPSSYSLNSARSSAACRSKTFIRQFSACEWVSRREAHILGLSASGDIWLWNQIDSPGKSISLGYFDPDSTFPEDEIEPSRVKSVAAGSYYGAAYITSLGIVFWRLPTTISYAYTLLPLPFTTIPGTGFHRRSSVSDGSTSIGEVKSYLILSCDLMVFYTDLNKIFAVPLRTKSSNTTPPHPVEIKAFDSPGTTITGLAGTNHAFLDQSFSVFTSAGAVHTISITQGWENEVLSQPDIANLKPHQVPALQSPPATSPTTTSAVVSLSPGSTHTLALHATGLISSHGQDPGRSGSLGLGTPPTGCLFRGLRDTQRNNRPTGSSELLPHATHTPHHIWFDPSQRLFLERLALSAETPTSRTRVASLRTSDILLGEFSEWVEQEGLAWNHFPGPNIEAASEDRDADIDPYGLGSYFALRVSSARYHGAAIVLVNEELAARVRQRHVARGDRAGGNPDTTWRWDNEPFPRVDLPSCGIMDGSDGAGISPWRFGKPPRREA
jgi:hypothetical protein